MNNQQGKLKLYERKVMYKEIKSIYLWYESTKNYM